MEPLSDVRQVIYQKEFATIRDAVIHAQGNWDERATGDPKPAMIWQTSIFRGT
jgi:hypothetical protein